MLLSVDTGLPGQWPEGFIWYFRAEERQQSDCYCILSATMLLEDHKSTRSSADVVGLVAGILGQPEARIFSRRRNHVSKVGVSEKGSVRGADSAGPPRGDVVLFRSRTPPVDHGASHRAVQVAHAGSRRLLQPPQEQPPRLHLGVVRVHVGVRVGVVHLGRLGIRLVTLLLQHVLFFLLLNAISVQSQWAGDVTVRVGGGNGPGRVWGAYSMAPARRQFCSHIRFM